MDFLTYIATKRSNQKIPSEIRDRWNKRVVARSLHLSGAAGANQYLADYGKGIGLEKVILFARQAELESATAMAQGFWAKAYELEFGQRPAISECGSDSISPVFPIGVANPNVEGLPDDLQPGRIQTMQAVDANQPNTDYAKDDRYWGQPKKDGNRLIIIATPTAVFYQSRSTELRSSPSIKMETALLDCAKAIGTFILDGELYYQSAVGSEHRTGAQAATLNLAQGFPDQPPLQRYAVFKALYAEGIDLRPHSERIRLEIGSKITERLGAEFEMLATAKTTIEKLYLIKTQQQEHREGEVWIKHEHPYTGGKDKGAKPMIRTKYLEELEVVITRLTPNSKSNSSTHCATRPFKAALISIVSSDGTVVDVGSVGSGFDAPEMQKICALHTANPGSVRIKVRCQGRTETGKLWHPRFIDFADS